MIVVKVSLVVFKKRKNLIIMIKLVWKVKRVSLGDFVFKIWIDK